MRIKNHTLHVMILQMMSMSQYPQYQINQLIQIIILQNVAMKLMVMNVIYQMQKLVQKIWYILIVSTNIIICDIMI